MPLRSHSTACFSSRPRPRRPDRHAIVYAQLQSPSAPLPGHPSQISLRTLADTYMLIFGNLFCAPSDTQIGKSYLSDLKVNANQRHISDGSNALVRYFVYFGLLSIDSGWVLMFAPDSRTGAGAT